MSKKLKTQAPEDLNELEAMDDEDMDLEDEMTSEDIDDMAEGVEEEKAAKEMTPEEKNSKIRVLLESLSMAKTKKDTSGQKKIRRKLRGLGFYLSREKEKVADLILGDNGA